MQNLKIMTRDFEKYQVRVAPCNRHIYAAIALPYVPHLLFGHGLLFQEVTSNMAVRWIKIFFAL